MKYESWQCQKCGHPVGWLGRLMERLFGSFHDCRNRQAEADIQAWLRGANKEK